MQGGGGVSKLWNKHSASAQNQVAGSMVLHQVTTAYLAILGWELTAEHKEVLAGFQDRGYFVHVYDRMLLLADVEKLEGDYEPWGRR